MKTQPINIALTIINLVILVVILIQLRQVGAQEAGSVLRGRALEIVDERGQVRARINVEPAGTMPDGETYPGSVVLRLTDPDGRIRVKLGADESGSGLVLADDTQQPGVHLLAEGSGSSIKVINQDGQEQVIEP